MSQKPENRQICPESAFLRSGGSTPDSTGDRQNAMEKNRFAKGIRVPPKVKLAVYAFLIRFKGSGMPKRPANKPNRSRCSFFKQARMAAS